MIVQIFDEIGSKMFARNEVIEDNRQEFPPTLLTFLFHTSIFGNLFDQLTKDFVDQRPMFVHVLLDESTMVMISLFDLLSAENKHNRFRIVRVTSNDRP